jgi:hypothetical protein
MKLLAKEVASKPQHKLGRRGVAGNQQSRSRQRHAQIVDAILDGRWERTCYYPDATRSEQVVAVFAVEV